MTRLFITSFFKIVKNWKNQNVPELGIVWVHFDSPKMASNIAITVILHSARDISKRIPDYPALRKGLRLNDQFNWTLWVGLRGLMDAVLNSFSELRNI